MVIFRVAIMRTSNLPNFYLLHQYFSKLCLEIDKKNCFHGLLRHHLNQRKQLHVSPEHV
jgi:hypothetical protein